MFGEHKNAGKGGPRVSAKRLARHNAVLIISGLIFASIAVLFQPLHSTSLWMQDQLFVPELPSNNVIVAGIDADTIAKYGRLADWPRRLHAQAVDNLTRAGAKVIAFDILFADGSPDDEILARSFASAGNVVLPVVVEYSQQDGQARNSSTLLPVQPLRSAARSIGHVNVTPDPGGIVRRLPIALSDASGESYPSFSLAALYTLFSQPLPATYEPKEGTLSLLARDVPVGSALDLRIDFSAKASDRTYISYQKIVEGSFRPEQVRNKVVLIGMTVAGEDTWSTPVSGRIPGTYVHAAAMDTILLERFHAESSGWTTFLSLLVLVLALAIVLPRVRVWLGALISIGAVAGYLGISFAFFDRGYLLNLLYPLSAVPFMFAGSLVAHAAIAHSERRQVGALFARYVSPQVAQEIVNLADCGRLNLNGETRRVTVLFADMRGYTNMSEGMTPEQVVETLNAHLSIIIEAVMRNGGMVNKFAGDNIMAVWGAPQDQPDQAALAVKAALEAQQGLASMRRDKPSLSPAEFGIGVNSGEAVAGNVGSTGRSEYTVIGDAVNLASRICAATPGGEVWVGPSTFAAVEPSFLMQEVGPHSFKGKSSPVTVYRAIGIKGS